MAAASAQSVGSLPHNSLLALVWTCFGAACLFVFLRTLVRLKVVTRPTAEDYWIFLALATLLTFCVLETVQLESLYYMTGVIAGVIPLSGELISQGNTYLRYEFPIIVLFWTVLWCVKASFLAMYFKLFRELPYYRVAWYILAVFTFLAYVGCIITLCLSCKPTSDFFKFGRCGAPEDVWASNFSIYFSTVVDVFTDVCSKSASRQTRLTMLTRPPPSVMAMPIRLIYNVKISFKQKAGLVCVFGLCFVMIAFSIIRAKQVLVQQAFVNLTLLMVWSTLGASVSVIVGSLPAFKLFLTKRTNIKRSKNSSFGTAKGATGGSGHGGGGVVRKSQIGSPRSGNSVPLGSFSSDRKVTVSNRNKLGAGDSQDEILDPEEGRYITVQSDVVSVARCLVISA